MSEVLLKLIERAKATPMTSEEREEQRISFAYGNLRLGNESMTRDAVARALQSLKER